jgi:hypothetical protein
MQCKQLVAPKTEVDPGEQDVQVVDDVAPITVE